uniref:Nuclear RNA export factor 1a n=1 Tax=Oncorhynchus kisutch TaxID=8019 RepID=A0A8C7FMV1_ONCKI
GGRMSRGPFRGPIYYDGPARQQRPRGGQMGGFRGPGPGPRVRFEDNYSTNCSLWQIPYGRKYDKKWLLTALQNLCSVPFTPVQYQIEGHKAQFYLEDACTANALCRVSRQITDTEGYKVIVLMNPCPPPAILNTQLKPEDIEHLKQCMAKRFDGSQRALDLNNIRTDPDLVSQNIRAILSRKTFMDAVVKIIEENIPELVCLNLSNNKLYKLEDVADLISKAPHLKILNLSHNELKSEKELDRLKGLKLVELWLDRNPLCDQFKDQLTYIRSVSEPGSHTHISPSECLYHKDSRNIKRLKDPSTRFRLLKHTRLNVVALLNELPKTQHDSASFNVDVNTYTTTLLSFTVSGMFKEVDGKSQDAVRAFSRVFIAVPAGISGLCIVNDELFVRIATTEEIQHAFAATAPTPSSSPVPTLTAPQQEMLSAFSLKSGMNLEWSQK